VAVKRLALSGRAGPAAAGAVLLFLAAAVLAVRTSPLVSVPKWDECLYLYDSVRVLEGQVPYRDFFNFTPPATFWLQALALRVGGPDAPLAAGRRLAALWALLVTLLLGNVLHKSGRPPREAALLALLFPLVFFPFWPVASHHHFALLFFLGALRLPRREKGLSPAGWTALGALAALLFLTLQTAFLSACALWGTFWALGEERRGRALARAAAGAAAALVPVSAVFAAKGALGGFLREVWFWPLLHYRREGGINAVPLLGDLPERIRSLWTVPLREGGPPFPAAVAGTVVYGGILVLLAAVAVLFLTEVCRVLKKRRFEDPWRAAVVASTAVETTLFLLGKPDWLHALHALARLGPLWLTAWKGGPEGGRRALNGTAALLAAAGFVFFGTAGLRKWEPWELRDPDRVLREAPVNRWLNAQPWLGKEDRIAAFPEGGQVYLYVRPAATGYTLLYPPSDRYHGEADYRRAAEEIEESRARCILLTVDREEEFVESAGALSRLLRERYHGLGRVGDAAVYLRRER
jgi:hypothetical protein